eukprot:CAMPEP_0114363378 /NCGR_PEP_ID=MMETSP0101-20121206/26546_1 /TAXON_ID=38822 ORGANISM="Pteridomonas danica, Strain PT" /NCGR_SAMPLE_ID=MMETSP0101 /ASSEMBLY_ACC=CAM_ASM_000211 /LENGTH=72 /DNA_ID=CAMNT_0001510039 /DNA_START=176 /DNA_END=391 /DNA_ORIENTATION=+
MNNFKNRHEFYRLVAQDDVFLEHYDHFIVTSILPQLKELLQTSNTLSRDSGDGGSGNDDKSDDKMTFYYQRP